MAELAQILAGVILRSGSGQSLLATSEPITTANIDLFAPTPETLRAAPYQLQQLGLTVMVRGWWS